MKHFLLLLIVISLTNCDKTENYDDVLPYKTVNFIVYFNNPEYNGLEIPGVWKETTSYGVKGVLIYNFNGSFKAFDLACPHLDPATCSKMTFDGSLFLTCPCDAARFSIYDGSPQTNGINYRAREYHVERLNDSQLRISN